MMLTPIAIDRDQIIVTLMNAISNPIFKRVRIKLDKGFDLDIMEKPGYMEIKDRKLRLFHPLWYREFTVDDVYCVEVEE